MAQTLSLHILYRSCSRHSTVGWLRAPSIAEISACIDWLHGVVSVRRQWLRTAPGRPCRAARGFRHDWHALGDTPAVRVTNLIVPERHHTSDVGQHLGRGRIGATASLWWSNGAISTLCCDSQCLASKRRGCRFIVSLASASRQARPKGVVSSVETPAAQVMYCHVSRVCLSTVRGDTSPVPGTLIPGAEYSLGRSCSSSRHLLRCRSGGNWQAEG